MACLGIAVAAISVAKGVADNATASYGSALSILRSLNPKNFDTRASFESAKASANATVQSSLTTLNSAIDSLKSASSALSPVAGGDIESVTTLMDAAHIATMAAAIGAAVVAVAAAAPFDVPIPSTPALPAAVGAATLAMQGLQC